MRILIKILCILLISAMLLAVAPVRLLTEIDWWAIGPGSEPSTSGNYALVGMVGQAVTFEVGEGDYDLYSGYLYLPFDLLKSLFLPLILK